MTVKNAILGICLMGLTISASAQPGRHKGGNLQQVTTISGTIAEWTYNDDFEYDGLYLNTGSASVFVKFPPHLAQQVRDLGKNLTVNGVFHFNREGVQELKMTSMSGNGQTVYDQKPMRNEVYVQEPFVNSEGKVKQLQINKKGDTVGYILENSILVRIPPRSAFQLSQMVQIGSVIGYTGVEKTLKSGHVRASDYKIIRCQTISVNGTQYMVR